MSRPIMKVLTGGATLRSVSATRLNPALPAFAGIEKNESTGCEWTFTIDTQKRMSLGDK